MILDTNWEIRCWKLSVSFTFFFLFLLFLCLNPIVKVNRVKIFLLQWKKCVVELHIISGEQSAAAGYCISVPDAGFLVNIATFLITPTVISGQPEESQS